MAGVVPHVRGGVGWETAGVRPLTRLVSLVWRARCVIKMQALECAALYIRPTAIPQRVPLSPVW